MSITLAYASLDLLKHPNFQSQYASPILPAYVNLPANPSMAQIKAYHRRVLAYALLWQLGKDNPKFQRQFANIYKDQNGRPQIPAENMDFNLSHSGNWVVVALAINEHHKPQVGIDIEVFPAKPRKFAQLIEHFGSNLEQEWFVQQINPEREFYKLWCMREAILKASGDGLRKLSQLKINPYTQTIHCFNLSHKVLGKVLFTKKPNFYLALFLK